MTPLRHTATAAALLLGACSFDTLMLGPGGTIDSGVVPLPDVPVVPVIDAKPIDSMPTIDSTPTPDTTPPECASLSVALPLDTNMNGTVTGSSAFDPSCDSVGSGGEVFYHVDIPPQSGTPDLVAEVTNVAAGLDPIADINTTCGSAPSPATEKCTDAGSTTTDEFVVFPAVTAGRRFVVVDSFAGSGMFTVRAWIRPLKQLTQTCDVHARNNRCGGSDQYCLDNGTAAQCTAEVPVAEGNPDNNDTACAAQGNAGQPSMIVDGVFTGTVTAGDADWIRLAPAVATKVRLVAYTAGASCNADLRLDVYHSDTTCDPIDNGTLTPIKTDDNGGLGACPYIDSVDIPATGVNFVKVTKNTTAVAPYWLVIDYHS